MQSENTLKKYICPLLAALATIIALFGSWFTHTTSTGRELEATLLEVIQGTAFVEYTRQHWLWISGIGVLLVLASAFVGDGVRKRMAESGSVLMLFLPGWSLFSIYFGDEDFEAGWAMWVAAGMTVAIIILARMIPEEKAVDSVSPQFE